MFNRQSTLTAIKRCIIKLKIINKLPSNGIALFCGNVRPINGRDITEICELIEPPLPISKNSYHCGKKFNTNDIIKLYNNHKRIGYVIITSKKSIILSVEGSKQHILFKTTTDIPTDTGRGGQSANRLARIRGEKKHNYNNKLVDMTVTKLNNGIFGIVVAGNAELPIEVYNNLKNDSRLQTMLLGVVKISGENSPIEESILAAESLLYSDEINQEKKEIAKIKDIIVNNPDKCVFGIDNIIKCAHEGILEYIICNESCSYECDCAMVKISHLSYLDDFSGAIGVLYYAFNYKSIV